jgi:hypothetical protein
VAASGAFAQGAASTTTLSGVVTDKDGGVVPGATVTVKNDATGVTLAPLVTNTQGQWSLPGIDPGVYTVTVTLSGFKTYVHTAVRILAGTPADLKSILEVGTLTETVEVKANSEIVRTNTATVSSTVTTEYIQSLPRNDRSALNFLTLLPGVETIGSTTNARQSTISGLPQNTINISLDGINIGNNLQSTDGFFSLVVPRLDAVEEVTMTSAVSGADSSGAGAVQIRFVTRSGTNQYVASIYEYFQHKSLNTNTFFNEVAKLPKPLRTIHNYGGRVGGPIVIPGVYDGRGQAFFFFNQEEVYQPNETRRDRTILAIAAQGGLFGYGTAGASVNLLALAATNNQTSTVDPVIAKLLSDIRTASTSTGSIQGIAGDPNRETFNYLVGVASRRHNPTTRVDFNLTSRQRLSGSYYWQGFSDAPDTLNGAEPSFPGFPLFGAQTSYRSSGSVTHRWTFSSNLVNEVLSGWQTSPVSFFENITKGMFDNQGGYSLGLGFGLTPVTPGNFGNAPQVRNTSNWNIDENLNWLRGNHSFKFGFSFTKLRNWIDDFNLVPTIGLGINPAQDPAEAMFTTTNFPGAGAADLTNARALYSLLTGRVTSIGATARLQDNGLYEYNGHIIRRESQDDYGFFLSDSWRVKPNLTLNYGLRYELQMPMKTASGTYSMSFLEDLCGPSGEGTGPSGRQCNMFTPGSLLNPGQVPTYVAYDNGNPGYNTDKNNFAPTIGVAWRPNVQAGIGRTILGDPDLATVSAGYTRTYNRKRFDRFTGTFGANPGATQPATRSYTSGQYLLVEPGTAAPVLYRETARLGPPPTCVGEVTATCLPASPAYPITASLGAGNDIAIFDPTTVVPYTDSFTVGVQRSIDRDTVVEFRYVGTKNKAAWTNENWNLENIIENNFLNEFKLAQQNLRTNVRDGRGGTFAFMGDGTGTSPLPTFLAHFSGAADPNVAANYGSTQFTNATWVNQLDQYFPGPYNIAANLWTGNNGVWRTNAAAAGLARNFWVMNPLVDDADVRTARGGGYYHSLQIDVRRRLSRGLVVQGSYTYAKRWDLWVANSDFHNDYENLYCANIVQGAGTPDAPTLNNTCIPHALKFLWNYQIPVGRGKRYGTDMNKWLDGAIGNWEFSGLGRLQIQRFRLTNNVMLVGMTHDEAQELFKQTRITTDAAGVTTVWNMPEEVVTNTRRAFTTSPTSATGYPAGEAPTGRYFAPAVGPDCFGLTPNDCGDDMFFDSPWFSEWDFKFVKRFPFGRKASVDFSVDVFNVFNKSNLTRNYTPSNSANVFRMTAQQTGARIGQLVWRVNF